MYVSSTFESSAAASLQNTVFNMKINETVKIAVKVMRVGDCEKIFAGSSSSEQTSHV